MKGTKRMKNNSENYSEKYLVETIERIGDKVLETFINHNDRASAIAYRKENETVWISIENGYYDFSMPKEKFIEIAERLKNEK